MAASSKRGLAKAIFEKQCQHTDRDTYGYDEGPTDAGEPGQCDPGQCYTYDAYRYPPGNGQKRYAGNELRN
ncbi:hypothetical protein GCM10023155_27260 [Bremerella cremea]